MKTQRFLKSGEKPKSIMVASGTWYEAAKGQHFQESERGQSWELWQDGEWPRLLKRFPKTRVLIISNK
jgi:hypothetical protein